MAIGDVNSNSAVAQGCNSTAVSGSANALSKEAFDLLQIFESLSTKDRMKMLSLAFELEENKK